MVVSGNRFIKIPNALYHLPKLKYLDISMNPLPETELEKFRKLRPDVELIFEPIPDLEKINTD